MIIHVINISRESAGSVIFSDLSPFCLIIGINIMRIRSLVLVLPNCEEGYDFNSFYAGMRMHLKAPLIYWCCHIMYTLGTMCQSPGRIYSKMCTLKPSLQSLLLRNTRFCGLPCAATTVHSAINKLCVVGGQKC
jgi:hypothetical protein